MATTATSDTRSLPRRPKRCASDQLSTRSKAPLLSAASARAAASAATAASARGRVMSVAGAQVAALLDEEADQARVQVPAREALELAERVVDGPGRLVRAVADKRVEDVADRADARD